jgi:hypothetical protein
MFTLTPVADPHHVAEQPPVLVDTVSHGLRRQGAGSMPGSYSETTNPCSSIFRESCAWEAG